jgi:hypothetical protein
MSKAKLSDKEITAILAAHGSALRTKFGNVIIIVADDDCYTFASVKDCTTADGMWTAARLEMKDK